MSEYSSVLIKELVDDINDNIDTISFIKGHIYDIIKRIDEHIEKIETRNKELIEERYMLKDDLESHIKFNSINADIIADKTFKIRKLKEEIDGLRNELVMENSLNVLNSDIIADKTVEICKLNKEIKELQNKLDSTIIIDNTFYLTDDKADEFVSTLAACIHDKTDQLKKYKKKYKAEITKNNVFIGEVMDILHDMNDIIYRPDHYKIVNVETLHTFESRLEGSVNRALDKEK